MTTSRAGGATADPEMAGAERWLSYTRNLGKSGMIMAY